MAYRGDLETRRAAVRRLEQERDALLREIELLESLPRARTIESRLLGAPGTLTREKTIDEPFDAARAEVVAAAIAKSYDAAGRIEKTERGMVWRADLEPRGRTVEVHVEAEAGRTRLRIIDRHSTARVVLIGMLAVLPQLLQTALNGRSGWWAAAMVPFLLAVPVFHAQTNKRVGRRRERQALAVESAVGIACATPMRARVESAEPEEDAVEDRVERRQAR